MSLFTIFFIAVGLAMDAFAVSVVSGIAIKRLRIHHALGISLSHAAFQTLMLLIGWLAGIGLRNFLGVVTHWVAFGLLAFIGGKMIYESRRFGPIERETDPLNVYVLLSLSLVTSIDALAVGITLSLLASAIVIHVIVIGIVTFVMSFMGVYIGDTFGNFFERGIEVIGGLVLIGIGAKILIEHLV